MERCADCYFYRHGDCRKALPTIVGNEDHRDILTMWPRPRHDAWCGEFKPKAEAVTVYCYGPDSNDFTSSKADAERLCKQGGFCYDTPVRGTWTKDNT